jgi:hypothetical protein
MGPVLRRLLRGLLRGAAGHHADAAEAAWWLALMVRPQGKRAIRALRILVEAVK